MNNFPLLWNFATLAQVSYRCVGKTVITLTCFCTLRHYLANSMLAYSYFRRRDFSSSSLKISLKPIAISETGMKQCTFKSIFSAQIGTSCHTLWTLAKNARYSFGERSECFVYEHGRNSLSSPLNVYLNLLNNISTCKGFKEENERLHKS